MFFYMCHTGFENNFAIASKDSTTTNGVPYDYGSVMHYGQGAFSNGNGSTIITLDPEFQDVIGQRIGLSNSDVKELNLRYQCSKCYKVKENKTPFQKCFGTVSHIWLLFSTGIIHRGFLLCGNNSFY